MRETLLLFFSVMINMLKYIEVDIRPNACRKVKGGGWFGSSILWSLEPINRLRNNEKTFCFVFFFFFSVDEDVLFLNGK